MATAKAKNTQIPHENSPDTEEDCRATQAPLVCSIEYNEQDSGVRLNHTLNITEFSGTSGEDVDDWLRQFTSYMTLYPMYNNKNLQALAVAFLRKGAGKYYDGLKEKPTDWNSFCEVFKERYGTGETDRSALMRNFLVRCQRPDEPTKIFATEMFSLGKQAGIDNEVIVQSIINNMTDNNNKALYRVSIREAYTLQNLIRLIGIVEGDTNVEKSQRTEDDVADLIERVGKMTLMMERNTREAHSSMKVRCTDCGKLGHSSHDCYRRESYRQRPTYKDNREERRPSSSGEAKIAEIERLLKEPIPSKIAELEKRMPHKSQELAKVFGAFPGNFDAKYTIMRNEHFAREIVKSLRNNGKTAQINFAGRSTKQKKAFSVVTCDLEINGEVVNCILDTGAEATLVSEDLCNKLGLPINTEEKQPLRMANSQYSMSTGTVERLPIAINGTLYPCEAIVMQDVTRDILIGTNWLGRYRAGIDLNSELLVIPGPSAEDDNCIAIQCKKIRYKPLKEFWEANDRIKCYAGEKHNLSALSGTMVSLCFRDQPIYALPPGCVLEARSLRNKGVVVCSGVSDACNPPEYMMVSNIEAEPKVIEQGELIGELKIHEDAGI